MRRLCQIRPIRPSGQGAFPLRSGIHYSGSCHANALRTLAFAALALLPAVSEAAAPVLRVSKSVIIHATPAAVWAKAKDFDALNTWHPAVAKDEIVAGTNNRPGAERRLTLGNGGTIDEKLLGFDDARRQFRYAILGGVLPVSHYTSTFRVVAVGKDSARVTWPGAFKRKDTGPHPAADANDAAATTAIGGVYPSGLDNLKKLLEAD